MAATNKTRETTFTMPSDREVAITRVFDAPRRLVFEAYTKCEHLQNWMLGPEGWTMPICEMDVRAGGAFRWGWSRPDGDGMEIRGAFREVAPPERLVTTESWGGDWPETVNTLLFSEQAGKTTISMTILYPSKEARDAALQTGMKEGTDQGFDRLDKYLQGLA